MDFSKAGGQVPYFETVIRYLGGLLSAHALSNDTTLLQRAETLADAIDPVFETPSGLAAFAVNPITFVSGHNLSFLKPHHDAGTSNITLACSTPLLNSPASKWSIHT